MNGPNSVHAERRYGERPVVLTNAHGDVLHGVAFTMYPVDEPPLIEVASVDRRLYWSVWEHRGWVVQTPIHTVGRQTADTTRCESEGQHLSSTRHRRAECTAEDTENT